MEGEIKGKRSQADLYVPEQGRDIYSAVITTISELCFPG